MSLDTTIFSCTFRRGHICSPLTANFTTLSLSIGKTDLKAHAFSARFGSIPIKGSLVLDKLCTAGFKSVIGNKCINETDNSNANLLSVRRRTFKSNQFRKQEFAKFNQLRLRAGLVSENLAKQFDHLAI